MIKRCSFLIILLLATLTSPAALEIMDTQGKIFEVELDFEESIEYSLTTGKVKLMAPAVGLALDLGEWNPSLDLSLDLYQIYQEDYDDIIEKIYLTWDLPADFKLKMGQFKAPFGYEMALGRSKRPYPGHSLSSEKMAPGYDRGISLAGNNLLQDIDFEAGLFSGKGSRRESASLVNLLPAAKADISLKAGSLLDMKLGYSLLMDLDLGPVFEYKLAQGVSTLLEFNFGKRNDLTLFGEFLEQYRNSAYFNSNPFWRHGVFAFAAYRISLVEPFVTYEHYRAITALATADDQMVLQAGLVFHSPWDIGIRLHYRWDYFYLDSLQEHRVEISASYQL